MFRAETRRSVSFKWFVRWRLLHETASSKHQRSNFNFESRKKKTNALAITACGTVKNTSGLVKSYPLCYEHPITTIYIEPVPYPVIIGIENF